MKFFDATNRGIRALALITALCIGAIGAPSLALATGGEEDGQGGTTQSSYGGDQTVDQSDTATVVQPQGNGNLSISPAIALSGDKGDTNPCDSGCEEGEDAAGATTSNYQGNGNDANAGVVQGNLADQSQTTTQTQAVTGNGCESGCAEHTCDDGCDTCGSGCEQDPCDSCGGGVSQSSEGGDQSATQSNSAEIIQPQGNGNVNISPAISLWGGDASTSNSQGNYNDADATVAQGNAADQDQNTTQTQAVSGGSGDCGCGDCCEHSGTPDASQSSSNGDQTIDQSNYAKVVQPQGNGNINISPAIAVGGDEGDEYDCGCEGDEAGSGATTSNYQGNGNEANAGVMQGNMADQSQTTTQNQAVTGDGCESGCDEHTCDDGCNSCESGCEQDTCDSCGSDGVSQSSEGGDQSATQSNSAEVIQPQGNGNVNISPAISLWGGNASTSSYQGNHNDANATVAQGNAADQDQTTTQTQAVNGGSGDCGCDDCCEHTGTPDVSQSSFNGDQTIDQSNYAKVIQPQGNGNVNFAPAIAVGDAPNRCESSCGAIWTEGDECDCHDGDEDGSGDATTSNSQGNGNEANATVVQGNAANQSQTTTQTQSVTGASGCDSGCDDGCDSGCEKDACDSCDSGVSQSSEGGDQSVTQSNSAEIIQPQGNGNWNISPSYTKDGGDASTANSQGNDNDANASVAQGNAAQQSQTTTQTQTVLGFVQQCCQAAFAG